MGDNDYREAEFCNKTAKKVEEPRLNRNIKPASWLIHKNKARCRNKITGDLQALLHAARKGRWPVINAHGINFDPLQPAYRCGTDVTIMPVANRHKPFADIAAR